MLVLVSVIVGLSTATLPPYIPSRPALACMSGIPRHWYRLYSPLWRRSFSWPSSRWRYNLAIGCNLFYHLLDISKLCWLQGSNILEAFSIAIQKWIALAGRATTQDDSPHLAFLEERQNVPRQCLQPSAHEPHWGSLRLHDFQIEMDAYKATNNRNTTLCQYLRFFGRSGAHVDFGELNMFHGFWKNLRKKHWQVGLYHHPIGNILYQVYIACWVTLSRPLITRSRMIHWG